MLLGNCIGQLGGVNLPFSFVLHSPPPVLADVTSHLDTGISVRADYVGQYAQSSLRAVANYVPGTKLQEHVKKELYDARKTRALENRVLVVRGLEGAGKLQLVLNYVRKYRRDYTAVFQIVAWTERVTEDRLDSDLSVAV